MHFNSARVGAKEINDWVKVSALAKHLPEAMVSVGQMDEMAQLRQKWYLSVLIDRTLLGFA